MLISWRLNFLWTIGDSPLSVPLVGLPFVFLSGCSIAAGWALPLAWLGVFTEILTRILWTPSHLLHESAVLRDQVYSSSNKGGCFVIHPLFTIYKLDPLDHSAHFIPPPSCRLATSIIVQQHPTKVRTRTVVLSHPPVGENGFVQFERLFTF